MPCSGRSWLADGAKRLGQQAGKSEDILPNFGKPGPSADHLSQAEVARTRKPGRDCLKGPRLSSAGRAVSRRCLPTREDSLQPRRGKVQESAYFDRQKPIGGIQEI